MGRAYDCTAPAIRAEQAKLGRGTWIHSLGVPAVTADMSGARLNVESGRIQCHWPQLRYDFAFAAPPLMSHRPQSRYDFEKRRDLPVMSDTS